MPFRTHLLAVLLALLTAGAAAAQESKGWLGVEVRDVTKAEADALRWDTPHGAKVTTLQPGSPAAKAGLKVGDIILIIDRTPIDTAAEFNAALEAKRPGNELRLQVLSGGREVRLAATLAEAPMQVASHRTAPQLMLDTGGHMAKINGIALTPDGKLIVSAANDKVVRVWDWQAGKTVRAIRGEARAGDEGKIYAMVLSPDGRLLAAGGWMKVPGEPGYIVRLYDFATGELVALLKSHADIIVSLAFSPDGKRLISGSRDRTAIIWDVESRRVVHRLKGHQDDIFAVGFTPDGSRAVTGSFDTTLKLWSVRDGKAIKTLLGHRDKVRSLAFSTVDGTIASGGFKGEIRLWDNTGRPIRMWRQENSTAGALAFSPDGKILVSGSGEFGVDFDVHVWDIATGKEVRTYNKHDNTVSAAAISPDGRFAVTGGGDRQEVHVWDISTGETTRALVGKGAPGHAAGFSPDGRRIAWGGKNLGPNYSPREAYEFALHLPGLGAVLGRPERLDQQAAAAFLRARTTHGSYSLLHRQGGAFGYDAILDLTKDGKVQVTIKRGPTDGYDHRSYTFSPDGQAIISGGDGGVLIAYDLKGRSLGEFVGHEGEVWSLGTSPDGRLLVSGSDDQTIRLWNITTRELIVTLFHGTDGEWVMWTPQGYYTGSPGADKIVGWQINKGPENAADYVTAEQLRTHLNRPDIVEKAIILASAEEAVRTSPGTSFKLADLLAKPVPKFRIVSPATEATVRGGRAQVTIAVEKVRDPIKVMRLQVNGRQASEITPNIGAGGFTGEYTFDVPLGKGRNDLRITLSNDSGDKAETLVINQDGEGALDKRGTLYILAIGVERYPGLGKTCGPQGNAGCDLRYAGKDARALVAAIEKRLGPSHTDVVKRVLVNGGPTDDAPTVSNIIDAIDLLKQAKETDTVLMFIAGHGYNDGPEYRFLPTNAEMTGGTIRGSTTVQWQVLQAAVERAKGRRILFVDTCHSGNAYNQTLGNAAYHANIIAYTSARFDQEALENAEVEHGLFTYALVEGLEGKGEFEAKREITTKALADFLVRRVDEMAKGMKATQEPQYFKGRDAEDYVLARW